MLRPTQRHSVTVSPQDMSSDLNHNDYDDDEDVGHIYRGLEAELSIVRAASTHPETRLVAIQQYMDARKEEVILHDAIAVKASLITNDDSNDEDRESRKKDMAVLSSFTQEPGTLVVTTERIMFFHDNEAQAATDFAIDATCIELHALQEDPELAVYIQAQDNSAREDVAPLELTIMPVTDAANTHSASCQAIFDALCKLISMHPIDPNENDDGPFGMMTGSDVIGDEMMFYSATDATLNGSHGQGSEATEEERERMLQRLDDMLVVPPDLEKRSDYEGGQFSDAEDDLL